MTLPLDARQRAMLAEMGIRLFDALPAPAEAVPTATRARPAVPSPRVAQEAETPVRPAPTVSAPQVPVAVRTGAVQAVDALAWDGLQDTVAGCRACALCEGRRNTVFGSGDRQADWLIVGEAPNEEEDLQAEPFVGAAGVLLDNMLRAVGRDRTRGVYLTHPIKCRPPGNRNPEPAEVAQCEAFLRRQIALLQPRLIVVMGRLAVQSLLQTQEPMGKLRGRAHAFEGIPLIVTYHPAYLLRNPADKGKAWADLCLAMDLMDGVVSA